MRVVSFQYDRRISAQNALFEMSIGEYLDLTREIIDNNPYQRRRIASSKTVYALLREDILRGCVLPPVVLALTKDIDSPDRIDGETAARYVSENPNHLSILDGLQRTYTLRDIEQDLTDSSLAEFRKHTLRVEVYLGLNKIGILYRMLTLNTGQTPMSLRQQIEMLYLDYLDVGIEGVKFIREVDGAHATNPGELNFKDTIDGFTSYLERDELPLDRSDLLENIKSLENLSHENAATDLFEEYVRAWLAFYRRTLEVCDGAEYQPEEDAPEQSVPWGKTAAQIFRKPQAMAGFGAALGKLKDFDKINSLSDIIREVEGLSLASEDAIVFIKKINETMNWINKNTKKIGNAQRMFFQFYFRDLFNPESDSYLKLEPSIASAIHKLESQLF